MPSILVGCPLSPFKMRGGDWHWWLDHAEAVTQAANSVGYDVRWLAVCQLKTAEIVRFGEFRVARTPDVGLETYEPLAERLYQLPRGEIVWFSYSHGSTEVRPETEWTHLWGQIAMARNMIIEEAHHGDDEWIYFADADIEMPDDILPRLLEMNHPVVGAHCPSYGFNGPAHPDFQRPRRCPVCLKSEDDVEGDPNLALCPKAPGVKHRWRADWQGEPDMDVRWHVNTGGSLMIHRDVFRRVPWRWLPADGMAGSHESEDVATQHEVERLGIKIAIRHDIQVTHHPLHFPTNLAARYGLIPSDDVRSRKDDSQWHKEVLDGG